MSNLGIRSVGRKSKRDVSVLRQNAPRPSVTSATRFTLSLAYIEKQGSGKARPEGEGNHGGIAQAIQIVPESRFLEEPDFRLGQVKSPP